MKLPLIVGNWKCNPSTLVEANNLLKEIEEKAKKARKVEVAICPPFIYLNELIKKKFWVKIGAQNCFWENKGAFTGEVSAEMLKKLGVSYAIVGHSERRNYFEETNENTAMKLKSALEAKLFSVLCIGETKEEKKEERTTEILKEQLEGAFEFLSNERVSIGNLAIAYEPVWAISANSNGESCSINDAMESMLFIRKKLINKFGERLGKDIRILYGGSVDSSNAKNYIEAGFEGVLVGSASLKASEFAKIIKNLS